MEKRLLVTGVTDGELRATIALVLRMCFRCDITCFGLSEDKDVAYFNYKKTKACPNEFIIEMDEDILTGVCLKWLSHFEEREMFGDGSKGRGWTVELGDWDDDYQFSVRFTTMYYGK